MPKKTATKFSPQDFYTRQKANEGVKLPLCLPDGTPTDEYLVIRGVDSDQYRSAETSANYETLMLMQRERQGKKKPDLEARKKIKLRLIASLVADWSLEEACSEKNIMQLLKEAPQILEDIDHFANDRKGFFNKPSVASKTTPEQSSS